MKLVIISGRSGTGKSIALRVLEESGYYCVDNIPLEMLLTLITHLKASNSLVAISLDVRNSLNQESEFKKQISSLEKEVEIKSIYLDSEDDVLLKRYDESRRLHPLSKNNNITLAEAIKKESTCLKYIADIATYKIDTSYLNIYELSDKILELIGDIKRKSLVINLCSFGFKYGLPEVADYVFDCRFLPNPHWEPNLRALTGLDLEVQKYFEQKEVVGKFINNLSAFFDEWLPSLEYNNRSYLTIAIGCTGGKHRSVYIVEELAKHFKKNKVIISHAGIGL